MERLDKETGNVQQMPQATGGQVNNQATKVGEVVNNIVSEADNQPSALEQEREERLALLREMRISTQTEVEPERYALSVDGTGFFALSDLHGLKGKQKSGKSSVLKVCTSALMCGRQFRVKSELQEPVVLMLDTEQQAADVKLVVSEVLHMSGVTADYLDSHLFLYTLRRLSYDTLLEDTRLLMAEHRPQMVMIDGVVDYVASFNDEVLSRQLIHDLLLLCDEYECAIVCVLHENKATEDLNMRGHLGTVLAQKAGSVLQCQKQDGLINVSCPDARHGIMPNWALTFDNDGHLCAADELQAQKRQQQQVLARQRQKEAYEKKRQERLELMLTIIRDHGNRISQKELVAELEREAKVGQQTARRIIKAGLGTKINEVNGFIQPAAGEEMAF